MNKQIGSDFEKRVIAKFAAKGYWVHFFAPDSRGAQPFDIIVVKNGEVKAVECKTCEKPFFSILRLQENQIAAFEKWGLCGNPEPIILVEHIGKIYIVPYTWLKMRGKVRLEDCTIWE